MFKAILAVTLFGAIVVACNKEVKSAPVFIFKPAPKTGLVAKIGDIEVTEDEMRKGIETDIFEQEKKLYDLKFNQLKSIVIKKLVQKEPDAKGMSPEEYLDKKVLSGIAPTQAAIDNFVKERKIPKEHLNDQLKQRIKDFLSRDLKVKAVDEWLAKKSKSNSIEIFLKRPDRPFFDVKAGDAPFKGGVDAKVTIIEFSDFECPFCAKGKDLVTEISKKYGKKVKIAFKHFPLPFHKRAKAASNASMCVHAQKKDAFWKMHDELFDNQQELTTEGIEKMAGKMGIDMAKFKECVSKGEFMAYIDKNIEEGKKVGVKSTPTFFVNGRIISGAQGIEVFEEEIAKHL